MKQVSTRIFLFCVIGLSVFFRHAYLFADNSTRYYHFTGTLSDTIRFNANLLLSDGIAEGNISFAYEFLPYQLSGVLNSDGSIYLIERHYYAYSAHQQTQRATWVLKPKSATHWEGYRDRGNGIKTKVELKTYYDRGNAQMEGIAKQKNQGDCGGMPCASMALTFPVLKNYARDKINTQLQQLIVNVYKAESNERSVSNMEQAMNDFMLRHRTEQQSFVAASSKERPLWRSTKQMLVYFNDYNLLCVELKSMYTQQMQQADYDVFYENYDLDTGQRITLSDIFDAEGIEKLQKVGEKYFRKHYNIKPQADLAQEGFRFEKGYFTLSDNFAIGYNGILFRYNPQQIAPRSIGATEFQIPYQAMFHLFTPKHPLRKIISK